jgi:DNA-binding transcriptional MerR regulator
LKLLAETSGHMPRNLQTGRHLRPVDLAREHGLSTQAVRNYEDAGVLPPAARTAAGYRVYTPLHASALRAFLALLPAHGHATATSILRAVHEGVADEAFRLVSESHAQLLEDRRTLESVERALRDLQPDDGADEPATAPLFIGTLAAHLGLRPATLRKWEQAGLLHPHRDPATGYRVYDASAVRDARLTRQLRRGGHLLSQIAPLLTQVRTAGGLAPLQSTLDTWHARLSTRARAMLTGAAALDTYLREREDE